LPGRSRPASAERWRGAASRAQPGSGGGGIGQWLGGRAGAAPVASAACPAGASAGGATGDCRQYESERAVVAGKPVHCLEPAAAAAGTGGKPPRSGCQAEDLSMSSVPIAGGGRPAVLSLSVKDAASLHAAYMPFVENGGLFIPSARSHV